MTVHAEEELEQGEYSFIAGGSANLYFRSQGRSFSENWESIYFKNQ